MFEPVFSEVGGEDGFVEVFSSSFEVDDPDDIIEYRYNFLNVWNAFFNRKDNSLNYLFRTLPGHEMSKKVVYYVRFTIFFG